MTGFETIQKQAKQSWDVLQQGTQPIILVGTASCGRAAGAGEVLKALREELEAKKIVAQIFEVGCLGLCFAGSFRACIFAS